MLTLESVNDVNMLTVNRVADCNCGQRNLVQGSGGKFESTRQRQTLPVASPLHLSSELWTDLILTHQNQKNLTSYYKKRPKITQPYGMSSSLPLKCTWT